MELLVKKSNSRLTISTRVLEGEKCLIVGCCEGKFITQVEFFYVLPNIQLLKFAAHMC